MYINRTELHCYTTMTEYRGVMTPYELVNKSYHVGMKAVAITDDYNVRGFYQAYNTWRSLLKEERVIDSAGRTDRIGNRAEGFMKVIYGVHIHIVDDTNTAGENTQEHAALIYAKNQKGLRDLYRVIM